ncbi:BgtTE-56036 [Blumeria graminis f. sp. tritici]|uniref:BgtTE-56036 n=1 Tax=Blumeria graminis f. sp. tritici TaxID=62690 RepID=A0A9X9MF39_BLUGR|nr:BgtTE-56036 [Blumeria graminis f. sp. tritici]
MVRWYIVLAGLPSRVWIAWTHIPLETVDRWLKSSKSQPHFSRYWYAWMTKACLDNQRFRNSLWWVLTEEGRLFV